MILKNEIKAGLKRTSLFYMESNVAYIVFFI